MTRWAFVAAFLAAAIGAGGFARLEGTAPAGPLRPAKAPPLLGILAQQGWGGQLVRLYPRSLAAAGRPRLDLQGHTFAWSFSPDGSRLVLGDQHGSLFVIDAQRLRRIGEVRTHVPSVVEATHWLGPKRIAAVVGGSRCCPREETVLTVVDLERQHVVLRHPLAGSIEAVARLPGRLVVLFGPLSGMGPARLLLVDAAGTVRRTELDRIAAGEDAIDPEEPVGVVHFARPGLTVDSVGNRAFVVAADALVAEVDLASLAVTYHEVHEPVSLLGRLHNWIEPAAAAKGSPDGPTRFAHWLGNKTIAVWGSDQTGWLDADRHPQLDEAPAGLRLIDTESWTTRTLDAGASRTAVVPGALLAWDASWHSERPQATGMGLAAYGDDLRLRGRLFSGQPLLGALVVGDRAFVSHWGGAPVSIVDLRSLEVVGSRRALPLVIGGNAVPWPM